MSEPGFGPEDPHAVHDGGLLPEQDHHHRRRGRGLRSCLPVLIAFVVLAVAVLVGGRWAIGEISSRMTSAPDYPGPGHGRVTYQVKPGATSAQIGRDLKAAGVVRSVDAFTAAANDNSKSRNIQVGFYRLKKQMKASEALDVLVDPDNLLQSVVTVPEGARVRDIVDSIVKHTDISRKAVVSALADGAAIGLPPEASGNPEGYLFPATYTVPPKETAVQLLRQMVAKSSSTLTALHAAEAAARLGLTEEQLVTVASILEYEANRDQDYPKVARAIYNRLKKGMPLQSDATVSYANGISGQVWTSASQRSHASPYNTYQHTGLPPGPIGSPGEKTLKAAMHPAKGPWLYWVVVNLRTGKTVFSTTLAQHNKAVEQFKQYCRTSTAC